MIADDELGIIAHVNREVAITLIRAALESLSRRIGWLRMFRLPTSVTISVALSCAKPGEKAEL